MRLHPILNIYRMHEGIDIINEVGTSVYASADGTVDFTGRRGGYGLAVEINHGYSLKTLYGHLSKIVVREGQQVKRGELIARSGNTGLSNGPHLHYEVRINGVAQNPTEYFFDDIHPRDFQN
jgi:murein DD-endopeptidase MepM/ murein hydrolase activator NlpD